MSGGQQDGGVEGVQGQGGGAGQRAAVLQAGRRAVGGGVRHCHQRGAAVGPGPAGLQLGVVQERRGGAGLTGVSQGVLDRALQLHPPVLEPVSDLSGERKAGMNPRHRRRSQAEPGAHVRAHLFVREVELPAELRLVLSSQVSVLLEGPLQNVDLLCGERRARPPASRGRRRQGGGGFGVGRRRTGATAFALVAGRLLLGAEVLFRAWKQQKRLKPEAPTGNFRLQDLSPKLGHFLTRKVFFAERVSTCEF